MPPELTSRHGLTSVVNGLRMYAYATQEFRKGGWATTLLSPDVANEVARRMDGYIDDPIVPQLMRENVGWVSYLHAQDEQGKLSFFAGVPTAGTAESICLTLKQLDLVDTSEVTWQQIHEFRRDADNVKRLRNLRLFLAENYEGKDPGFVRDDLERRIEEYREAARVWGFPLHASMLEILLNDKTTAAYAVTTLLGVLLGTGVAATIAGLVGATMTLGRVAWEVGKRRHHVGQLSKTHALAYLVGLKGLGAAREQQPPKALPGSSDPDGP
jgi:hypothetical protein